MVIYEMGMEEPVSIGNLIIKQELFDLVESVISLGTGIDPGQFWMSLDEINADLGPKNSFKKRDPSKTDRCLAL
ncbi:MAG: hypothetical protein QNK29_05910 [Desulfobacterales bacterium]|nr:hypothetical protein [Desulfobacterales bacterium]MDX2511471.1 hypothetical protein [Desulfobacterales bacterium]